MLMEELGEIDEYYGMRKQANPPPFLVKTYMLVEDPSTDDAVSWNSDGTSFVVWQPAEFARDLLPTLFKHSNFSSFIRQLNTYGFRKVATSRWEFCNDKFQKGKKELLCLIRRRKAWAANRAHPSPPPSTSEVEMGPPIRSSSISSSSTSEQNNNNNNNKMASENKRLKRENGMLTYELSNVKGKCKELMELVASYKATSTSTSTSGLGAVRTNLGGEEDQDQSWVKLFGVRLDASVKGEYDDEKKRKTSTGSAPSYIHLPRSCKY